MNVGPELDYYENVGPELDYYENVRPELVEGQALLTYLPLAL